jgi:hypothetical protein
LGSRYQGKYPRLRKPDRPKIAQKFVVSLPPSFLSETFPKVL